MCVQVPLATAAAAAADLLRLPRALPAPGLPLVLAPAAPPGVLPPVPALPLLAAASVSVDDCQVGLRRPQP